MSEILTIKEHLNFIGREQLLAITWEPDFSQACSFDRMLINNKIFHFTQTPRKNNDTIFLKSPKTMFLGHFWPFLVILPHWDFFPKNPALSHTTIYGPQTPCQVSQKTNEPIPTKLMDRLKEGWKDRQTLFYRPLLAEVKGPINLLTEVVHSRKKLERQELKVPRICFVYLYSALFIYLNIVYNSSS